MSPSTGVFSFPPLTFVFDLQVAKERLNSLEQFQHVDMNLNASELCFGKSLEVQVSVKF